jgi:hypothetical protein
MSAGVLNLSIGGALIRARGLSEGEITGIELVGPDFRYSGVARVAHHDGNRAGLRFLTWHGHSHRPLRALIEDRTRRRRDDPAREHDQRLIRRVAVIVSARGTLGSVRRPPGGAPVPRRRA